MPENQPPADGVDPLLPRPLPVVPWPERLRALLASGALTPARALGAAAVLVVVVLAAVFMLRSPAPPAEDTLPMASSSVPSTGPSTAGISDVVVHAAGAVTVPGVYTLPAGSRVTDLVAAAGGLAADADPDRVNLAAALADGQRVYVPRVGEAVPADVGSGGAGGAGAAPAEPVDLNQASATELDALPGIGPATASAIIEYREAHGRFRSVDELLEVRGIGDAKLAELRPLVRV